MSETPETNAETTTSTAVTQSSSKKRLTRDTNNKIIGGVCSGIANYFEVDPVLVRVIFAVALFGFGVGPLAYILMLIIMPEA